MTSTAVAPHDRWLALAALTAPVCAGAAALALGGAPNAYLTVNLAALAVAWVLMWAPPVPRIAIPAIVSGTAVALLAASLLLGPETAGVRRWIAVGPLRLHAGMLILPALAVVLPQLPKPFGAAVVAGCAVMIWLQPDLASASALFLGVMAGSSGLRLIPHDIVMRACAAGGLIATSFRPDPLGSVRFVETALSDGWAISPVLGAAMAAALVAAVTIAPQLLIRGAPHLRHSARGLIGAMCGFAGLSLILPYPQPLIGYGASAILGYGLALAVLRQLR
ncbi:MAG: hypothetical protein J0M19_05690 [Sphingomonadales bacterium]|nr:hypothetical protein [Sphingomonadales bacterium]